MAKNSIPSDIAKLSFEDALEQLEEIPETGTDLQLGDYNVEIVQTSENVINLVRIRSPETTMHTD